MDSKKLILELNGYMSEKGLKKSQVEKEIGLPLNSLSNFLSLKKDLPSKWNEPILKYISQSNVVINTLGNLKDKVTTADKVPLPKDYMAAEKVMVLPTWAQEIEKYCEKEGITPEDLILSHQERNKPQKSKKGTNTPKVEEDAPNNPAVNKNNHSNWFDTYRKQKLGLK